jgi:hypothetical protein
MNRPFLHAALAAGALVLMQTLSSLPAFAAPEVLDPAWTVSLFSTVPGMPGVEGISIDGQGRVYVCAGSAGVFRFDTSGTAALWSLAVGAGQATLPDGQTFVPSRDLLASHYLWHVSPDGSYSSLVPVSPGSWTWAAVTASQKLYVLIWAGSGEGIYSIDTNSGAATPVVTGGPGLGGSGFYRGITTIGETVVVAGSDGVGYGLYELTGGSLALMAATPQSMLGICNGPDGIYAASGDASGGQVWKIAAGSATLFARYFGNTNSVAYDPTLDRFYVLDSTRAKVWVIKRVPTPTRSMSIGKLHLLYR